MDMKYYCIPDTADVVQCLPHLKPENAVEVEGPNPDPNIYVASSTGEWVVGCTYKEARRAAILKEWSITDQLEALTESNYGKPEKLHSLTTFLKKIKLQFPKD